MVRLPRNEGAEGVRWEVVLVVFIAVFDNGPAVGPKVGTVSPLDRDKVTRFKWFVAS